MLHLKACGRKNKVSSTSNESVCDIVFLRPSKKIIVKTERFIDLQILVVATIIFDPPRVEALFNVAFVHLSSFC